MRFIFIMAIAGLGVFGHADSAKRKPAANNGPGWTCECFVDINSTSPNAGASLHGNYTVFTAEQAALNECRASDTSVSIARCIHHSGND